MRVAAVAAFLWMASAVHAAESVNRNFTVSSRGEAIAIVRAGCAKCAWGSAGREAVALRLQVDGRYSQHILLARGEPADYRVSLGALGTGSHRLTVERDQALSAADTGAASIDTVDITFLAADDSVDYIAQSYAPVLYARPNTIGRFTDLPLVMWYEIVSTQRGRQIRYSVVFSNEDGGTPTDRLMATWGRTTDIEYIYGVELDDRGRLLAEEYQGPGHEVPAFKGRHEARHPLLFVSTDNNMVSEAGQSGVRYAPAPDRVDLTNVSREVVMDRQPWIYAIAAGEVIREGKVDDAAAPGTGKIPDPRRFVHVEACTELQNAAVTFSVRTTDANGAARWHDSDRGLVEFQIVRTGCFRGAVPLPASAGRPDAVRFRAMPRPPQAGTATATAVASVTLTRVNKVFTLDDAFLPRPSMFSGVGNVVLPIGGDWMVFPF